MLAAAGIRPLLHAVSPVTVAPLAATRVALQCFIRSFSAQAAATVAASKPAASATPSTAPTPLFAPPPPRPVLRPRKRKAQIVRPTVELPPMVADHPQHRALRATPPGRRSVAHALGNEYQDALEKGSSATASAAAAAAAPGTEAAKAGSGAEAGAGSSTAGRVRSRAARQGVSVAWLKAQEAALKAHALQYPPHRATALFAVVGVKGKQYKVTEGDIINAEYIPGTAVGSLLRDTSVHVVGSQHRTLLGRPFVQGATVALRVEEHASDRKVIVFKKRRRKRYQRTQGHRRLVTRLRVEKITCDTTVY